MGRDTAAAAEEEDDWNTADPDTIMIPNSQSSPTTGAYYSMPTQNLSYRDDDVDDCLSTNQHARPGDGDLNYLPCFYGLQNQDLGAAYLKQQLLEFEIPTDIFDMNISRDADFPRCTNMNKFSSTFMPNLDLPEDNNISLSIDRTIYKNEGNQYVVEDEERASRPLTGVVNVNASEDEYNWRKYGQKQVKGSKYPRSYYKCTHPNCEAKKKAERAQNGNITQIIYKGKHNHPKPIPNRRFPPGSAFVHDETDTGEDYSSHAKIEGESVWKNMNSFSEDDRVGSINRRSAGLDTELAESVLNQLSIANPPGHEEYFNPLDSAENEEVSSPPHRQDADDEDIDETDSKRRRTDDCMVEPNTSSRGIREDKIMVQAESVIDIIEDGYRWRKYGQKVVKGNPNPRSYYKCTSAGCLVRKHVERNPQNIKDVITTYEGKHNHEVPPAKNSSSPNKNVGHLPSVPFTGQASHMSLTRSSTLPKVEIPDRISPHFRRTSFPGSEFFGPGLIGNYGTAMNFGGSSVYHSDFPMPYRSLGLNMPNLDNPQVGMTSAHASDLVSQQPLLTHAGSLNSNMTPDFKIRISQLAHHPSPDFDVIRPKQEKVGNITDDSSASKANSNESSSLPPHYGQGFPF